MLYRYLPPGPAMAAPRRPATRHGYTLVEMVLVSALALVLVGAAYQLFYRACDASRDVSRTAWLYQNALLIRDEWRHFVHQCPPGDWQANGESFRAITARAEVRGEHLLLNSAAGDRRVGLPPEVRVRFTVDQDAGLAPCAVLTLEWTPRGLLGRRPQRLRLAACRPAAGMGAARSNQPGQGRNQP